MREYRNVPTDKDITIKKLIDIILEVEPDTSKSIFIGDDIVYTGEHGTIKGNCFHLKRVEHFGRDVYLIFDDWRKDKVEELENQKTGHWVFQGRAGAERVYNCSNCGRKITRFDELVDFEKLFAYCPQCGAKMKGEENE